VGVYLYFACDLTVGFPVFPTHVGVYLTKPMQKTLSITVFPTHVGVYRHPVIRWCDVSIVFPTHVGVYRLKIQPRSTLKRMLRNRLHSRLEMTVAKVL